MPDCAPLAVPYVPFQQTTASKYSSQEALSQGILFPGLNLPFHLKQVGAAVPQTPLTELQALCFVVHELGLYLDTHQDDQEAFALFQKYSAPGPRAPCRLCGALRPSAPDGRSGG